MKTTVDKIKQIRAEFDSKLTDGMRPDEAYRSLGIYDLYLGQDSFTPRLAVEMFYQFLLKKLKK